VDLDRKAKGGLMETFYYMVIELKGITEEDTGSLNTLGRGGYELVTVIQVPSSMPQKPKFLAYLKNTHEMVPRSVA